MKYFSLFSLIFLFLTCGIPEKYPVPQEKTPTICGISLIPKNIILTEQKSCTVSLLFLHSDGTRYEISPSEYTLITDNENILCNKNILIARKEGDTIVTVHYLDLTDSLTIHIQSRPDYSGILISEILYDPSGTEPDGEYIEIYNNSDKKCSLDGVSLIDGNTSSTPFIFSDISIAPYSRIVVAQSQTEFMITYMMQPDASPLGFSLNNTGESIFLKDPSENIIDAVYIKNGTAEYKADAPWGSLSAAKGKCLQRKILTQDTDSPEDFESGNPTPGW